MPLEKQIIAARLQEINEGLTRQTGGIVEAEFRKSKKLGAAARVCSLIRGQDVINDYRALLAAGGELGIGADTLEAALNELQEIDYVTLHRSGGDIAKIEERVPLLNDRYEAIGQRWTDIGPSEVERATVNIVDDLMMTPMRERDLIRKHGLDNEVINVLRDVGKSGDFYQTYRSPTDAGSIAFSPLYHDENPEKFIALIDKYRGEDVIDRIRTIRSYQGKPVDLETDPILREAIKTGCLPTPSVNSTAGPKQFVFTPLQGVGQLEKSILEKARAIVACVRYGQHFAGVTRIVDPLLILTRLRDRKVIGPHSEIKNQYVLLQKLGIGRVVKSPHYTDRYLFRLTDTDENLRAFDLAIQYLTVTDVVKHDSREADARQLLLPGMYGSPTKTRLEVRSVSTTGLSAGSVDRLNHLIIGGSSGLV
ncbi:MAG: hypothetical protein WD894_04515 [Pirellulales bacterium]